MIRLNRPECPNPVALQTNYRHPVNKEALRQACHDKCMYCESKVSHTYYGDIEHIKPKSLFPNLEFIWGNLGYVCAQCNGAKANKWCDATPFVNPFEEDPSDHLAACGPFIYHRHGSERGELTCREIDLNRNGLLERRMERINAIRALVDTASRTSNQNLRALLQEEMIHEVADDKPYALISRATLHTFS